MITIIDYGMGNLASMLNMIRRVGGDAVITSDLQLIKSADVLILPGVGAFDNAMQKLRDGNFVEVLKERVVEKKVPFLGVCLGMQLLFASSEEGVLPGMGFISGEVKKFNFMDAEQKKLKVPHMGWNAVSYKSGHVLFAGFEDEPRFYFVHSYYVECENKENVIGTSEYGHPFASIVQKDNIVATQFHPEKSHKFGMKLLENFLGSLC